MQVLSRLPGRLRVGGLLGSSPNHAPTLAHQLEDELGVLSGIRRARADPLTGNILVLYDPARYSEAQIQALLLQLLGHLHANGDDLHHHHDHEQCGHHHETNMTAAVSRLVLGGAIANLSGVMAIVTGYPFFRSAFRSLSGREKLTTDTLMSVATIASIVMRESITGLIVIWLLNLGELLQMITLRRTRRAIEELLALGEANVRVIIEDGEVEVALAALAVGDRIAVYAGERISVDGWVYQGGGAVNEAPVTGESIPIYKNPGDPVFAGTILVAGALKVEATAIGDDTTVGRLIQRVEEAVELRAPIETVGERFAGKFMPLSFVLSAVELVVTGDFRRSMTMPLIACPCAAGLATPTAVSAAIGNGARRGILIKGGTHLENAGKVDTVIFDKTGTLTLGNLSVTRVIALTTAYTPEAILALAASGGLHSRHPGALWADRWPWCSIPARRRS